MIPMCKGSVVGGDGSSFVISVKSISRSALNLSWLNSAIALLNISGVRLLLTSGTEIKVVARPVSPVIS